MQAARLIVLGVAVTAGLGAAYLMSGTKQPEPVRVTVAPPPPIVKDAVLVAAHDLSFGATVTAADLRWQPWPKDELPVGVIAQSTQPNGIKDVEGSLVRSNFLAGEPIRRDRLVKGGTGFLSAVLQPGYRAVAIDLADQGKSAAGGFVLPNDRVDVIRTFHPDEVPTATASETILTNIRVLAIGQTIQEKSTERTAIGSTATLEVTPEQAEKLVLAQRTGQLTLTLRSMAASSTAEVQPEDGRTMTIIRFGNASQARVR